MNGPVVNLAQGSTDYPQTSSDILRWYSRLISIN